MTTTVGLCKHNLPTQGVRRCHFCRDGREPSTGMCTCSCGCARAPMADPGVWAECYCWCHVGKPGGPR